MEDSIVNYDNLRSQLADLMSNLDEQPPESSRGSRIIAALFAPLCRSLIVPVADVQRRLIALLLEYDSALTEARRHVEQIRTTAEEAARGIESLRGDSSRIMDHLAALQEDHDMLREIVARSHPENGALSRSEKLWSDLQRDVTTLAEAVSRLDSD
jgi:methyl-accepting chemotaxis protein